MEYAERGSIMQGKDREDPVAEPRARDLFRQLVFGLEYCTDWYHCSSRIIARIDSLMLVNI